MPHDHEDHDFNSIKVQLKLPEASPLILAPIFQFHKGTIKTSILLFLSRQSIIFQFHKGTIKTKPKMLREPSAVKFQFHKGTIKTLERTGGLFKHCISIP